MPGISVGLRHVRRVALGRADGHTGLLGQIRRRGGLPQRMDQDDRQQRRITGTLEKHGVSRQSVAFRWHLWLRVGSPIAVLGLCDIGGFVYSCCRITRLRVADLRQATGFHVFGQIAHCAVIRFHHLGLCPCYRHVFGRYLVIFDIGDDDRLIAVI